MASEITVKTYHDVEATKTTHMSDVLKIIDTIEYQSGWKIKDMIKSIRERQADSFSVSKDRPNAFLFLHNGIRDISLKFKNDEKEMVVSIPKTDIDTTL